MNPEETKKSEPGALGVSDAPGSTARKIAIIVLSSFIVLSLAFTAQFVYGILSYDKIYDGVSVNGHPAGGMSRDELSSYLRTFYTDKIKDSGLVIRCGNRSVPFRYTDVEAAYDISGTADRAYSAGRTGNIIDRLYDIIVTRRRGTDIPLDVSLNRVKTAALVNALYDRIFISVKEADLLIQEDKVTIRSGHHGESFDREAAVKQITDAVRKRIIGTLAVPLVKTYPTRISVDGYLSQINRAASNATISIKGNSYTIIPHVIGRYIGKPALTSIASQLEKTENTEMVLPVTITIPKITTAELEEKLFRDTLYTASTKFYTSTQNDRNRSENIRIAVPKINGTLLGPGQVFSFNQTVGPRLVEEGYKEAYTFVPGKVIAGIGGGICQVSSTLYNAVLYADLEIVERTNHMFVVSYVPYGLDATVSYGQVDFKFRNNTDWPLKIVAYVTKDNCVEFSLKGTKEYPGKTVELDTRIIKTTGFKDRFVDDPTLDEGKTAVWHSGSKGYVVDTYKIVKLDGKTISNRKISTSVYSPLDREVRRGTRKAGASTPAEPVKPQKQTGVDDAGNPPAKPADTGGSTTADPGTANQGTTNQGTTSSNTTNPGTTSPSTTNQGTTDSNTTNPSTTNPGTGTGAGTTENSTTKNDTSTATTQNAATGDGGLNIEDNE